MLYSRDLEIDEPTDSSDTNDLAEAKVTLADRTTPRWALILGASFGLSIYACTFAVILLSLLFHSIVIETGESRMATVLLAVGLCFIAGIALLEFVHAKSLAGFRWLREKHAQQLAALFAVPVAMIIFFVHPVAGLTIPLCVALGWLAQWRLAGTKIHEAPWVFLPDEAVSLMAGRDGNGVAQATQVSPHHALSAPLRRVMVLMAVLLSLAIGSYLISELVLEPAVILPLALICSWCVNDALKYTGSLYSREREDIGKSTQVLKVSGETGAPGSGLVVSHLTVRTHQERALLTDISLVIEPGEIVGIIGESGAGKSLLMRSLIDPFSLADVQVSGRVTENGVDLWQRFAGHQNVPAVFVPDSPIIMPATGAENLSCFQGADQLKRGQYFLEQMVFAHDLVHDICATEDASLLPSMQRKALALSRAFALSPLIYFLDRPEDALQSAQISALCNRFDQEVRLGRSIVIVSDDRMLLEKCDRLYVLQSGTLVDFGPAKQVRERRASGWHRFIAQRLLSSEANLQKWIRSHFRREGDEANRRRAALVASELLALSCREADLTHDDTVEFLFKNFEGYCALQMRDRSPPISSGQVQKARDLIENKPLDSRRNPLATVIANCLEVDFEDHLDGRMIKATIETYDPRKSKVKPGRADAQTFS